MFIRSSRVEYPVSISIVSDLRALLSVWRQVQKGICVDWQGAASGCCLWWLPWEGPGAASAKWPQAKMNTWVKLALASQKTVAPPGFAFTYHSLRAGAATAAHSIGVSERKIRMYVFADLFEIFEECRRTKKL